VFGDFRDEDVVKAWFNHLKLSDRGSGVDQSAEQNLRVRSFG
jgi:hypothetical protein